MNDDGRWLANLILGNHAALQAKYSAPAIVRERCPFCGGRGTRECGAGMLRTLERCAACVGHGTITVEAP